MLQVLLHSCVAADLEGDAAVAAAVLEALRGGEEAADVMLCLPGETDAAQALRFARAAIDWWEHRLVVHEDVIAAIA